MKRCVMVHRVLACAILAACASTVGCRPSTSLSLAPVTGTVKHKGQPLVRGTVVFTPMPGTLGPQAVGNIGSDGSFQMQTAGVDGAAVGEHKVTVHSRREHTPEESAKLIIPPSLIPEKYGKEDQSGLSINVQKGSNEYPIELP